MARQRRSERPGDRRRVHRWRRSLAVAVALLTACAGEAREPRDLSGPSSGRPPIILGGGGGGTGGGVAIPAGLVGEWKTVIVIFLETDVQTWTTVWRFDKGGSCRLTKTSFSLVEGFPRVDDRVCSFTVQGTEIIATFPSNSATMRIRWDYVGTSSNRLRLEGVEYERIG